MIHTQGLTRHFRVGKERVEAVRGIDLDIAMGLVHEPGSLFLDEPSTGLDPQSRANLWEHIVRL